MSCDGFYNTLMNQKGYNYYKPDQSLCMQCLLQLETIVVCHIWIPMNHAWYNTHTPVMLQPLRQYGHLSLYPIHLSPHLLCSSTTDWLHGSGGVPNIYVPHTTKTTDTYLCSHMSCIHCYPQQSHEANISCRPELCIALGDTVALHQ